MDQAAVINASIFAIAVTFTYAGVVSARAWLAGRTRSLRWIAFAMFLMATTWAAFRFFQFETTEVNRSVTWVVTFLALTIAQWCLLRFALELADGSRRLRRIGDVLFGVAVAAQLLVPDRVAFGIYDDPSSSQLFVHLAIAVATLYGTIVAAVVLWRAGRGRPRLVRNRHRLLATAIIALHLAMLGAAIRDYPLLLVFAGLMVAAIVLLIVAAVPPRWLRDTWQAPQLRRLLRELAEVSAMTDPEAVRARLLPTIARAASAQRAVLHDLESGRELEVYGIASGDDVRSVRLASDTSELELVGAPHDPFFGFEEQQLVRDLGLHLEVALERCSLLERERAAAVRMSAANERLIDANAELSELAELRDGFVAIASHELRTPITTIMGFSQTLLDLWTDIDDAERLRYLELVDRDARRLGQLVGDLLLLSSVESPDFRVTRSHVPVRELLEQVLADVGSQASDVELHVDDDLSIHADPRHLRQVFVNLVANAARHGAPPIRIRARAVGDFGDKVQVEVVDSGPGIPEEFRERLFVRFTRADVSAAVPGSGLGLFIVRRLVEVQGGRVWLQDSPGTGASFVVELPAAAPRGAG